MEIESLEEYRSLLRRRNEATLFQRIKYIWTVKSTERNMIIVILVCLIVGIAVLVSKKVFLDNYIADDTYYAEDEESMWSYNDTDDKEMFKKLWMTANETLFIQNVQFGEIGKGKSEDDKVQELARCALTSEYVKRILKKCISLDILPEECRQLVRQPLHCSSESRYRTIDGSCNNLNHLEWGMSYVTFNRWLKPTFADDVSLLRQSVHGVSLPPVRYLSVQLFSHKILPNLNATMLFTHFGLFLDHDIVQVGQTRGNYSSCCENDPKLHHPACLQIKNPPSDPVYGPVNVTCKGFMRSPPAIGACPGRREQQNRMTAFIDASDVYGPTNKETVKLRKYKRGLLRVNVINNTPLLPTNKNLGNSCYAKDGNYSCFLSGDIRVNLLMPLMVLHTLWMREHNRIAEELHSFNPDWNDETLFQESRRLLIAELQHITYREFLPVIFDFQKREQFGLLIDDSEDYDSYDETMNPGIHHGFSTAAFRFGHTLVQDNVELRDENYELREELPLRDTYLNPSLLYNGGFDGVIRGMLRQKAQDVHRYTTEEIRGRLMQRYFQNHGFDLTAMSIERGRDHGIPPYLHWRKFCNLPIPNSWEDLYRFMKKEYVDSLRNVYLSIEDIDLIPGGLGEYHEEGSLVGPTYTCLIYKQFLALRRGDRFWFENPNQPGSFTKDQLKEIYKSSFARILCDNSDDLYMIQKYPFFIPSKENPIIPCEEIAKVDLSQWSEDSS